MTRERSHVLWAEICLGPAQPQNLSVRVLQNCREYPCHPWLALLSCSCRGLGTVLGSKPGACRHRSLCEPSCSTGMVPVWKGDEAHGGGVCRRCVKGCGTEPAARGCGGQSCCHPVFTKARCLLCVVFEERFEAAALLCVLYSQHGCSFGSILAHSIASAFPSALCRTRCTERFSLMQGWREG